MKKFQVLTTTEGCATNLLENSTYRNELSRKGWQATQTENADVIVLNTCGHTQEREDHTFKVLKQLKEKYPNKKIVVGGCLAKINPKKLNDIHSGKTFSPGNTSELWSALEEDPATQVKPPSSDAETIETNLFDAQDFTELTKLHKLILNIRPLFSRIEKKLGTKIQPLHNIFETVVVNEEFYGITVGQGCAGKCTFCAIKMAKGHIKSKPIDTIIDEFYRGIKQGHDKFWLLGDDIGCYGIDRGESIVDLLKAVLKIDFPFKLVINYLEPMFFEKHFNELEELLSDPRIVNINLPIQSGSQRIIHDMGREYDPNIVRSYLKILKKKNPNLIIKNNIIVGFPGERFVDLIKSIKSCFYFDANLAIPFALRPGTKAAKMPNQIGPYKKKTWHVFINFFIFIRHAYILMRSIFFSLFSSSREMSKL